MSFTLFHKTAAEPGPDPAAAIADDEAAPVKATPRLTPDGHEVEPGAIAQGFPVVWPTLRVEAVFLTVEPDSFQGRVLCDGVEVATTEPTDAEPEAIVRAEALIVDAFARLFRT